MSLVFIRWAVFLTLVITSAGRVSAIEPIRAGQETFISRAIFVGSQLWLLTDAGTLSAITEGSDSQVDIALPEAAFDLWIHDGEPAVLTGERSGGEYWTLRKWSRGAWKVMGKVATNNDQYVAVGSLGGTVTVLTSRRLIDMLGSDQTSIAVAWPDKQRLAGITSILVTPESVLVGFNAGEWGGGLRRVDRKTGGISTIESKQTGELCSGPLNADCDPVNAIAAEPEKVGCAAIAIGLVHFLAHGRIVEVCGTEVRRMYSKPFNPDPTNRSADAGPDEPISTVPFFGVVAVGEELWAVGINGIYQIRADHKAKIVPLPKFQRIGKVSVSFALPQVVLVRTDVNKRRSVTGSIPMMVVR